METKSKFICNFFQMFDYFSIQYSFRLNDQTSYKSCFGGAIFSMYLVFSIIYFWITFAEFWKNEIYTINYSIVSNKNSEMNLKESKFRFAFEDLYDNSTKLEIYHLNNQSKTKIDYKDCTPADFHDIMDQTEFNNLGFNSSKCIDFNKTIKTDFDFKKDSQEYKVILIQYSNENLAKPSRFRIDWFENLIDPRNPNEQSNEYIVSPREYYLNPNEDKGHYVFISSLEFSSDKNILVNDTNTTYLSYIDWERNIDYKYESNVSVLEIFLALSPKQTIIERKYKKLPTFLAEFGSINTNLLLILSIFVRFINQFWSEQKLMNKILKFTDHLKVTNSNQMNLIKEKLKKTNIETLNSVNNYKIFPSKMRSNFQNFKEEDLDTSQNNLKCSSFSAEMTEKNQKITPINTNIETEQRIHLNLIDEKLIKEREKLLEEMRKPIFFNCYEIILRPCCCRYSKLHLKNLLYQKALKKINYSLDVINYIKKMQEIDILKYLLLDKDQIKLFNFLTLPSMHLS